MQRLGDKTTRASKRNESVELLRCLLMFLVVLGHVWGAGIFSDSVVGMKWWMMLLMGALIWHVDGFVSISGWYGIRFSWKKFFSLVFVIWFYSLLLAGIRLCAGEGLRFKSFLPDGGWFGNSYLALMLCAPFVNAAVDSLANQSRRVLVSIWALLALVAFLTWAPLHLATSVNAVGFTSQSFLTLMFVYLTARTARAVFCQQMGLMLLVSLLGGYVVLVIGYTLVFEAFKELNVMDISGIVWKVFGDYHSPFVYGVALVVMMLFAWHVRISGVIGRVVTFISPSMFGVYLFHSYFTRSSTMTKLNPLKLLNSFLHVNPFCEIIICAIVVFLISVGVDLLRRLVVYVVCPSRLAWLEWIEQRWKRLLSQ